MLEVKVDTRDFDRMAARFAAAGKNVKPALQRAINHTGAKAKTKVIRALVPQTGLTRKTIVKAVRESKAGTGGLVYELKSRGGNVSLKYFGARETRTGVSAAPWNSRRVYAGSFIKGGLFPKRVALKLGGHAFVRSGSSRLPIEKQKSGLFIPTEMVTGQSAAAFNAVAASELPKRLAHEIEAILGGVAPGGG
jgi:hypothetical protein